MTPLALHRRAVTTRLYLLRRLGARHALARHRLRGRHARVAAAHGAVVEAMWRQAATALGADVRRLSPWLLEVSRAGVQVRIRDQMTTPLTDRVSHRVARDKPLAYGLMQAAGVPVPEHCTISAGDVRAAREFLERLGPPLVVKPASGGGGAGVIGNIHRLSELRVALADAGRYHSTVLVERHVAGDCYRLLVLDGEVLDVLRRRPPKLVGDGVSTVEQLLFREAERRITAGGAPAGYPLLEVDVDLLIALARSGVGLRTRLPLGVGVTVKSASNVAAAEQIEPLGESSVPGIVEPARRAAAALGVRLAGVDVVTQDPACPLAAAGCVLEVNPVPGLLQHYTVSTRSEATPVATLVLASLLHVDRPSRMGVAVG